MRRIRGIAVAVVGGTVLALGVALLALPGPAVLVIPAGLAILATEFAWAKRWLRSAQSLWPRRGVRGRASVWDSRGTAARRGVLRSVLRRLTQFVFRKGKVL